MHEINNAWNGTLEIAIGPKKESGLSEPGLSEPGLSEPGLSEPGLSEWRVVADHIGQLPKDRHLVEKAQGQFSPIVFLTWADGRVVAEQASL